jgi:hypothetical protein
MAEETTIAEGTAPETIVETPEISQESKEVDSKPEKSGQEDQPEAKPEGKPDNTAVIPEWRFKQEYKARKELERKVQELESKAQAKPETPKGSKAPNWEEYESQGKSVAEFNEDYLDYHYESKRAKEREREAQQTQESAWQDRTMKASLNYQMKSQSAKANHEDYDIAIQNAQNIGIGFAPIINLNIDEDENAGELRYHLSTNHEDAYALMSLPHDKAIAKLGRISAKLPTGKSQPANLTKTGEPPEPLNGGGKAPSKFHEKMSLSEFDAMFPPT